VEDVGTVDPVVENAEKRAPEAVEMRYRRRTDMRERQRRRAPIVCGGRERLVLGEPARSGNGVVGIERAPQPRVELDAAFAAVGQLGADDPVDRVVVDDRGDA